MKYRNLVGRCATLLFVVVAASLAVMPVSAQTGGEPKENPDSALIRLDSGERLPGYMAAEAASNSMPDEQSSGVDEASFLETGLWVGGALALLVFILMACIGQAKRLALAIALSLKATIEGADEMLSFLLAKMIAWLRAGTSSQATGLEQAAPLPEAVRILKALIALIVAGAAALADFMVLKESIVLICPWAITGEILACTIVALTALSGLLLHSMRSRFVRGLLLFVIVTLVSAQGLLSYLRTVEIERVSNVEASSASPATAGQMLIRNANRPASPRQEDEPAPAIDSLFSDAPISQQGLLAALMAVLFAVGEILGFYGGFYLAGGALVWICAAPALGLFAVPLAIFRLLKCSRVVEPVEILLTGFAEMLAILGHALVRFSRMILPSALLTRFFLWQQAMASRRSELRRLRAELSAIEALEKLRRDNTENQLKNEIAHLAALKTQWCKTADECIAIILDETKQVVCNFGLNAQQAVAESVIRQHQDKIAMAAHTMTSSFIDLLAGIDHVLNPGSGSRWSSNGKPANATTTPESKIGGC